LGGPWGFLGGVGCGCFLWVLGLSLCFEFYYIMGGYFIS